MLTKYRVYTVTSNFLGAGFRNIVYIQIFGKINSNNSSLISVRFPLQTSIGHTQKFQQGQIDIFESDEELIDKIKKIRITHEELHSCWHLKYLVIEQIESKKQWKFYCNKWVYGNETGLELKPLKKHTEEYNAIQVTTKEDETDDFMEDNLKNNKIEYMNIKMDDIKYKIKIVTSEFSKKETDLKLKLKIIGRSGETGWIKISELSLIHIFKTDQNDVGEVTLIS